jgi:hypothetical protein
MKAEMAGKLEKLLGKYFHSANENNKIEWQGVVIGEPHPRVVPGATVRVDFRRAHGAKTCANREDDRLVVLSRCERDGVWLKTLIISNHTIQPRLSQHLTEIKRWQFQGCGFFCGKPWPATLAGRVTTILPLAVFVPDVGALAKNLRRHLSRDSGRRWLKSRKAMDSVGFLSVSHAPLQLSSY